MFELSVPRAGIGAARRGELNLTGRFDATDGDLLQQLALTGSPRPMLKLVVAAIGKAIAQGRRRLVVEDLLTNGGQRSVQDLGHESFH